MRQAWISSLKLECSALSVETSSNPFFSDPTPNSKNIKFQISLIESEAFSRTPLDTINSSSSFLSGTLVLDIIIADNLSWISFDWCDSTVTAGMTKIERRSVSAFDCFSSEVILGFVILAK